MPVPVAKSSTRLGLSMGARNDLPCAMSRKTACWRSVGCQGYTFACLEASSGGTHRAGPVLGGRWEGDILSVSPRCLMHSLSLFHPQRTAFFVPVVRPAVLLDVCVDARPDRRGRRSGEMGGKGKKRKEKWVSKSVALWYRCTGRASLSYLITSSPDCSS